MLKRNEFWLGGVLGFLGLVVGLAAPVEANAADGKRAFVYFDRSGGNEREGKVAWRTGGGDRAPGAPVVFPTGNGVGEPAVPEPTAALLFGAGALVVGVATRRRRPR